MKMKNTLLILTVFLLAFLVLPTFLIAADDSADYVVVVSEETAQDAAWSEVVDALVEKHDAQLLTYDPETLVEDVLPALRSTFPRYACFVAKPEDAGKDFVASVHQLTRQLDDDPYADLFWGVLSGYDADAAMLIVNETEPLVVENVLSATDVELSMFTEGVCYDELVAGHSTIKTPGEDPETQTVPTDTTKLLVDGLNGDADLFITSGHATESNWMIGFRYRNGFFVCNEGTIYGRDTEQELFPVDSDHARVFLPIGNCLMGHINGPDCMALAYMRSAGIRQMIGYTVPTWFGYAGWGVLDYYIEQPGRYTLTEAFFANHQALIHKLDSLEESDPSYRGMLHDRDVVGMYGDPAWSAKLADNPNRAWEQVLLTDGNQYTLIVQPNLGEATFEPINVNGSQRGGRPIIHWLPNRVENVEITKGAELDPVVTDNFILIPNPGTCDPEKDYGITFTADLIE